MKTLNNSSVYQKRRILAPKLINLLISFPPAEGTVGCDQFGEAAASSEEEEEEEEEGVNMSCTLFKHGFKKITFAYFYWSLRRLLATKKEA